MYDSKLIQLSLKVIAAHGFVLYVETRDANLRGPDAEREEELALALKARSDAFVDVANCPKATTLAGLSALASVVEIARDAADGCELGGSEFEALALKLAGDGQALQARAQV